MRVMRVRICNVCMCVACKKHRTLHGRYQWDASRQYALLLKDSVRFIEGVQCVDSRMAGRPFVDAMNAKRIHCEPGGSYVELLA